jgi:hypothetical protein
VLAFCEKFAWHLSGPLDILAIHKIWNVLQGPECHKWLLSRPKPDKVATLKSSEALQSPLVLEYDFSNWDSIESFPELDEWLKL